MLFTYENSTANCTIPNALGVKGIRVLSGYEGTIINFSSAFAIGDAGLEIWDGSFVNSAQVAPLNGPFRQFGGISQLDDFVLIMAQSNIQETLLVNGGTIASVGGFIQIDGATDAFIYSEVNIGYLGFYNHPGSINGRIIVNQLVRYTNGALNANIDLSDFYSGTGGDSNNPGSGSLRFIGGSQQIENPYIPSIFIQNTVSLNIIEDLFIGGSWHRTSNPWVNWNGHKATFLSSTNQRASQIKNGAFDGELVLDMTNTRLDIVDTLLSLNLKINSLKELRKGDNSAIMVLFDDLINNTTNPWFGDVRISMWSSSDSFYSGTGELNTPLEIRKDTGKKVTLNHELKMPSSHAYLKVTSGDLDLNGKDVIVGRSFVVEDTLTLTGVETITINGSTAPSTVLEPIKSTVVYRDTYVTADMSKLAKSFYNLTLGANKTHEFKTGAANQIEIKGIFASNGSYNNRSILRSENSSVDQWYLKLIGISALGNAVEVENSNANAGKTVNAIDSLDYGNNENWLTTIPIDFKMTSVTSSVAEGSVHTLSAHIPITIVFEEYAKLSPGASFVVKFNSGGSITFSDTEINNTNNITKDYIVSVGESTEKLTVTQFSVLNGSLKSSSNGVLLMDSPSINIDTAKTIIVDAMVPTITSITSSCGSGIYGEDKDIDITITFSERVTADGLSLSLNNGVVLNVDPFFDTSVTVLYRVGFGDTTEGNPLSIASITIVGNAKDDAGNNLDATLSTNLNPAKKILIDAIKPTISSITSSSPSGVYKAGETINITINFSEPIVSNDVILIQLNSGSTVVILPIHSASANVSFDYEIGSADSVTKPTYLKVTSLTIADKARDVAGNKLSVNLPSININTAKNIEIDTVVPSIVAKVLGTKNAYADITFNEGVYATNNKTGGLSKDSFMLTFNANGGSATAATITEVTQTDGTPTQGGESTVRLMLSVTGLVAGTETIAITPKANAVFDIAGNAANSAVSTDSLHLFVDAASAPTVTQITSSTPDGLYKKGDSISIQISFDTNVNIFGTPRLLLKTGAKNSYANYTSGSGTTTLTFIVTTQRFELFF